MNIKDIKSVYFIGIGGIGMSALARFFHEQGATVSGYDKTPTTLTKQLQNEGITIHYTEDVNHISDNLDLVVYTPAIPTSHKELQFVRQSNIPLMKRAQVLGLIVNSGDCFAVAGSHGKSTTSAMLAHVLQVAGKNATGFLGAIAANYQSNYIPGSAETFVVEADEYDRSFHQIKPLSTIITAVDSDHLDIYGTVEGVEEGFIIYLNGLKPNGTIFIQANEKFQHKIEKEYFTYGIESNADYTAKNLRLINGVFHFDVQTPIEIIDDIQLNMGGRYNIENALAVIAMTSHYGVSSKHIKEAMQSFKGLHRRFEFVLNEPITFIDDYAHHPNEIRAFIEGVRELYPDKHVTGIFQPHLYSRTKDYAEHFAESLDLLDEAYVMDIYPAREEPIAGVNANSIIQKSKKINAKHLPVEAIEELANNFSGDVLLTIGAGDISKQVPKIKNLLTKKRLP